MSEQKLIRDAKTDPHAFGKLYDQYYPKIFNYILRRTASAQVAQDITANTFIKVLKHLQGYTITDVPFSAWIYRIATHEIANHFRDKSNLHTSLNRMVEEQGFEIADTQDIIRELEQAQEAIERKKTYLQVHSLLMTLEMKYQEVITLRFFERKKVKDISIILGKNEGTVKSLLSRGLEQLRRKLPATKR